MKLYVDSVVRLDGETVQVYVRSEMYKHALKVIGDSPFVLHPVIDPKGLMLTGKLNLCYEGQYVVDTLESVLLDYCYASEVWENSTL